MQIADNVALITGGASGLGEATARHLHAAGARVLIFDRDEGRAKDIVAAYKSPGFKAAILADRFYDGFTLPDYMK